MINEESVGLSPLTRRGIPAGEQRIRAVKVGYLPLDTVVSVNGTNLDLKLALNPVPEPEDTISSTEDETPVTNPATVETGNITVNSTPSDAGIWLNGRRLSNKSTPSVLTSLEAGTYRISVRKDGYHAHDQTIKLDADAVVNVDATLIPRSGGVHIQSEPAGAIISIDGLPVSDIQTPTTIDELQVGEHTLSLQLDGYQIFDTLLTIQEDSTSDIMAALTPANGRLSILALPYGSIYIDGTLFKKDSHRQFSTDLQIGPHDVRVVHPTYGTWQSSVTVYENRDSDVTIDFNRHVSLRILAFDESGKPIVGDIYVDGEFTESSTPKQLSLRVGLHRVEVRKPGYSAVDIVKYKP